MAIRPPLPPPLLELNATVALGYQLLLPSTDACGMAAKRVGLPPSANVFCVVLIFAQNSMQPLAAGRPFGSRIRDLTEFTGTYIALPNLPSTKVALLHMPVGPTVGFAMSSAESNDVR
jgi:hypothetical protein